MPSYVLLNSSNHVGLNAGGAVLLNAQDAEAAPEPLTYGAGRLPRSDYESQVRAHWERIEAAERQEHDRKQRIAELERQQAAIAEKRQISARSALAKRRAKIARELEQLEAQQAVAEAEMAELRRQIDEIEAVLLTMATEAQALIDRRRRMMLVLAAAAA